MLFKLKKLAESAIFAGLSANAFGQAATLIIQVLSVPLYLHYWSLEKYGQWVVISSIPIYISLMNFGVTSVAMNSMTMRAAKGEYAEANRILQTATTAVTAFFVIFSVIYWAIAVALGGSQESKTALYFLIATVILNLNSSLIDGVFRSYNRYATGTNLLTAGRLVEWGGSMIGLALTKRLDGCAAGLFLGRSISLILLAFTCGAMGREFRFGFAGASLDRFKGLVGTSVQYMAFPLGTAFSIQGVSLVVGMAIGNEAAAIYNSYRTVSRISNQLIGAIGHTLWPRFSRLFAKEDWNTLDSEVRRWSLRTLIAVMVVSVLMLAIAKPVFVRWTHGKIDFELSIMAILILASAINSIGNVRYVLALATNKFGSTPALFFSAALGQLVLCYFFCRAYGIYGALVPSVIFEIVAFYIFFRNANKIVIRYEQ
ncbi:hypothetical protein [Pseudacidovorax sp. 1753]|uniref:lipopolysaccharide biosynthesis protein n=1 Tax=Pseudacidovorax sp. 1753 TaxID=3156419 RepID=UPI003399CEB9